MKTYILLGVLLLAGLSFAITQNWMMYSVNGYGCGYHYYSIENYGGHATLRGIAGHYGCGEYWDCNSMDTDAKDIGNAVWGDGSPGMCTYSGCWDPPYPVAFKSNVLTYNLAASDLKAKFLAGLRAYLAENPDERSDLQAALQDAMAGYRECLSDSYGRSCYMCI